jgi:hypothetical protein
VISVNFKLQRSAPKTKARRRSIALDTSIVEVLREHRLRQLKERDQLGLPAQQPDDLVFSQPDGEPFTLAYSRTLLTGG